MTGDEGYILAKVLTGLFRNRPSCAVTIFVSIIVIVLGGMLFQAETPDDRNVSRDLDTSKGNLGSIDGHMSWKA